MSYTRLVLHAPLAGVRALGPAGCDTAELAGQELDPLGDRARAEEAAAAAAARLLEEVGVNVARCSAVLERRLDEATAWIVELGLGLASHVLEMEIDAGRYDLAPAVRAALRGAVRDAGDDRLRVLLHPADLDGVLAAFARAGAPESDREKVEFEVDQELTRGRCRVETRAGEVMHDPGHVLGLAMERIRGELCA